MPAALGCLSGGGFGVHGQNNMEIFKLLIGGVVFGGDNACAGSNRIH